MSLMWEYVIDWIIESVYRYRDGYSNNFILAHFESVLK